MMEEINTTIPTISSLLTKSDSSLNLDLPRLSYFTIQHMILYNTMSCVSIAWSCPLCTLYQVLTSSLPPFQPCEISAFALWSLYSISRSKYCFQFSNYNMIAGFGHRVLSILGFFFGIFQEHFNFLRFEAVWSVKTNMKSFFLD